jgi:hypothetical protein
MASKTKDEIVKELSDALLKVRPLGGSELFIKFEYRYIADPKYCGDMIDKLRLDLHEAYLELARNRKK